MLLPTPTVTATPMGMSLFTPPAITAFASAHMLAQRQATDDASESTCDNGFASFQCHGKLSNCIKSVYLAAHSKSAGSRDDSAYEGSLTSCYCTYGTDYPNCYYSVLTKQTCYAYPQPSVWVSFESDWFSSICGTVPHLTTPSVKSKNTIVSLYYTSVTVVTRNSSVSVPTYTYSPIYQGTGSLLADECASTRFTLIDDVSTVLWLPYVGCAGDRPQCCPWTASSVPSGSAATATNDAFPVPAATVQNVLLSCPADYSSVWGGRCCPSGYAPFTRDLGGQTPCWSSMTTLATPPSITAGLTRESTQTQKPTLAVANIVWSMSYPIAHTKHGLSAGGIAGAVVGSVVGAAAIATFGFFLWRARRKNRRLQGPQPAMQQQQQQQ